MGMATMREIACKKISQRHSVFSMTIVLTTSQAMEVLQEVFTEEIGSGQLHPVEELAATDLAVWLSLTIQEVSSETRMWIQIPSSEAGASPGIRED